MTSHTERETLISEIAKLQEMQLKAKDDSELLGLTSEQSLLAFDARLTRMTLLVRRLAELDALRT